MFVRPRSRVRAVVALAFAAAASAVGFGGACLPDLPAAPGDAGADATTTGLTPDADTGRCGDGIVQRPREACDPGDAGFGTSTNDSGNDDDVDGGGDDGGNEPSTLPLAVGCTSDCQIACPDGGLVETDDHCYFVVGATSRDESDTAAACAAANAHIVTISSEDESGDVNEWLSNEQLSGFYYVGLMRDGGTDKAPIYQAIQANEPGWSSTCSGCYAAPHPGAAKSFLDICTGYRTIGTCVIGSNSSANPDDWSGIDCAASCGDAGTTALHVCEREPVGSTRVPCDDAGASCITIKTSSSIYELVLDPPLDAVDATRACATKHGASHPGHLVVFDDAEERESLSRELAFFTSATSPTLSYWVGLSRSSSTADFLWADSDPVDSHPLQWADGQPLTGNYAFAELSNAYDRQLLQTSDGTEARAYLCELE